MKSLKILCGLVCLLLLAGQLWSMSRWNEARGVYDDICYLRQAHLFQRFGLGGFDTDISRDDDGYLASKLKEIGFPVAGDKLNAPCHNPMPATKKFVLQYPPGTGFVLALFPEGHQVIPLYRIGDSRSCSASRCLASVYARYVPLILLDRRVRLSRHLHHDQSGEGELFDGADHGDMRAGRISHRAPVCGTAEMTTAFGWPSCSASCSACRSISDCRTCFCPPAISCSSSFRSCRAGKPEIAARSLGFGVAFLAGMAPTLARQCDQCRQSLRDHLWRAGRRAARLLVRRHPALCRRICSSSCWHLPAYRSLIFCIWEATPDARRVALIAAANLAANLAFFFSHPLFTPYYTVPIAMLSLWSLSVCHADASLRKRWTNVLPGRRPMYRS